MKSKPGKPRRLLSAMLAAAVASSLFAALPLTAVAAGAAQLAEQINAFAHGGEGSLSATASGDTVTVTGKVEGVSKSLGLSIDSGVRVVWKADYSGPGSLHLIYLSDAGVFEVPEGGSLIASGTITYAIGTAGTPPTKVVVSGGTVRAENTAISANASVEVSSGTVENTTNGLAISCGGTVTVSGGSVGGKIGSTGAITISGGTVANKGVAIQNYTDGSSVTISGGLVESQVSGQTIDCYNIAISGGTVRNTGTTSAIIASKSLTMTGGTVCAVDDHTIRSTGVNAVFNISGGFVFAYGTDAVSTEVIYGGRAAVRNYAEQTTVGGSAVACAWNKAAGRTAYYAGTSDDLDVGPSGATAVWALEGGESGIRYANGSNTGFFPIDGVTVSAAGAEEPQPTPEPEEQPDPTPGAAPSPTPAPPPSSGGAWGDASDWAIPELEKAESLGLIPESLRGADFTRPITRAEFAAVSVKVYENLSGQAAAPASPNPFIDTMDLEVLKAFNVGITAGTSAATFEPALILNREQAATMLARVYKRTKFDGWTLATDAQYQLDYTRQEPFSDDALISDWAKDSVYFMVSEGIILGMGDNLFGPRNTTSAEEAANYASATREQALLISTRMVESLG